MRNNTVGTHSGSPTLTAYDPIKHKPGSALYNEVSGPTNAVSGSAKYVGPGTYQATSTAAVQVPNAFANTQQPSVPRRNYIPTISLDQLDD